MDLRNDDIDAVPIQFDFAAGAWERVLPDFTECEEAAVRDLANTVDLPNSRVDIEYDFEDLCDALADTVSVEPVMNFLYPITLVEDTPERAQAKLLVNHSNLVLVDALDQYYLALTGGGMDMRWYIARAYMLLGQLPPVCFANLPRFAGEEPDRGVVRAMKRSVEIMIARLHRSDGHVAELWKEARE